MANVVAIRRVGFIGLGNMGRPMATRLAAAGFSLVVHDVDRTGCQRTGARRRNVGRLAARAWPNSPP